MNKSRTRAEINLVDGLFHDINAIGDLVRGVLWAYYNVASVVTTGRGITSSPNPFIQVARHSITIARSRLDKMIEVVKGVRIF
jgi:hypothetical protein